MNKTYLLIFSLFSTLAFAQHSSGPQVISLNESLQAFSKAPAYQASESRLRSIDLDFSSKDLGLQPRIELNAARTLDDRESLSPGSRKDRYGIYGLSLIKPFSTGTELRIAPTLEDARYLTLTPNERSTVDWQVSITQNLWRDGFGRSTRLRWEREDFDRLRQVAAGYRAQGQLLTEFESVYWDWALALREIELREKNVKRGQEILKWVRDRFNRSAAESTDLLQAQALLTNRQLQFESVQQRLTQIHARAERYLPGVKMRPDVAELSRARDIQTMTIPWKGNDTGRISRLDFLEAKFEAQIAQVTAREAREGIRPELGVQVAYGKNSIEPSRSDALRDSFNQDNEQHTIGMFFRTGLDLSQEYRKVESAQAAQQSAELRRQSLEGEDKIAWEQLQRDVSLLQGRIMTAEKLVGLQNSKANAERERYRKGRTTAFQAITFEQDAAEAEIGLLTLYAQMRMTEAQARQFAR